MRFCLILCATLLAAPRIADACGPPTCWPGYFTPGESATVPANLPAIYWRPMKANVGDPANDPTRVTLVVAGSPLSSVAFTAQPRSNGDYLLVPDAPLIEGATYQLTDHNLCNGVEQTGPTARFTTTAAASLPTSLGTLSMTSQVVENFLVGTSSGSCSTTVEGDRATVGITLDSDAAPWADVLQYTTTVDAAPWIASESINDAPPPGASIEGRGRDTVYDVCDYSDPDLLGFGLAAGAHDVQLSATLPGTPVALNSSVVQVDLRLCQTSFPGDRIEDGCNASGRAAGPLALIGVWLFVRRRRLTK